MQEGFQKTTFKVMLILIAMQACFFLITYLAENKIKSQKEFIYKSILGEDFVDCLMSTHLMEKNIDKDEYQNNPQVQAAQNRINMINIASVIAAVVVLYLFSFAIVKFFVR